MNCTDIPPQCRIGDICGYIWLCFFSSFLGNIFQFVYASTLKNKIRRLLERIPFLETLDEESGTDLPEATVIE